MIGSMKRKKLLVHHLSDCSSRWGRLHVPGPMKRVPSSLELVMLQCAVPASRPIEELAATVATRFGNSCVLLLEDSTAFQCRTQILKFLLTASENLSHHFLSTSKTIICSFPAAWKAERTLFALA